MDISESHSVVSDSLQPRGPYSPWDFPGKSTGVGCHCLLHNSIPRDICTKGKKFMFVPHACNIYMDVHMHGSSMSLLCYAL